MKAVLVLVVTLVVLASAVSHYAGRGTTGSQQPSLTAPDSSSAPTAQSDEASPDIKVVLVNLRPEGCEPEELQLTAGEYLFIVRNRSGLEEVNLRLIRENQQLADGKIPAQRKDWKQRLKLTPGTYQLTESTQPEWTCRIVVER